MSTISSIGPLRTQLSDEDSIQPMQGDASASQSSTGKDLDTADAPALQADPDGMSQAEDESGMVPAPVAEDVGEPTTVAGSKGNIQQAMRWIQSIPGIELGEDPTAANALLPETDVLGTLVPAAFMPELPGGNDGTEMAGVLDDKVLNDPTLSAEEKLRNLNLQKQTPEELHKTLADPRVQQLLGQLAKKVDSTLWNGLTGANPQAAAELLSRIQQHMPKEVSAEFAQRLQQNGTLTKLIASAQDMSQLQQVMISLFAMASNAAGGKQGNALVDELGQAFAQKMSQLRPNRADLENMQRLVAGLTGMKGNPSPALALAIAKALTQNGESVDWPGFLLRGAIIGLNNNPAISSYAEAAKELSKLNLELQTLLQNAGPLTNQQRVALIQQFKQEHAQQYEKLDAAAKALQQYMINNKEAMIALAAISPEAAANLLEGLKQLCASGDSQLALEFAKAIKADPGAQSAMQGLPGYSDIVKQAVAGVMQNLAVDSNNPAQTAKDFVAAIQGLFEDGQDWPQIKKLITALGEAAGKGDAASISDVLRKLGRLGGPVNAGLGAAALVLAMQHRDGPQHLNEWMQAIGSGGANTADIAGLLAESIAKQLRPGLAKGALKLSAQALSKLSGVLNVLVSTAAFIDHVSKISDDPSNAGNYVAAIGDLLTAAGSLAIGGVISAPVGALLVAAGTMLSLGGDALAEHIDQQQIDAKLEEMFAKMGLDPRLGKALIDADPVNVSYLQKLGFSIEQMQAIAMYAPDFLKRPEATEALEKLKEVTGMSTDDLFRMMMDVGGPDGQELQGLVAALAATRLEFGERYSPASVTNKEEYLLMLEHLRDGRNFDPKTMGKSLQRLIDWIRNHA